MSIEISLKEYLDKLYSPKRGSYIDREVIVNDAVLNDFNLGRDNLLFNVWVLKTQITDSEERMNEFKFFIIDNYFEVMLKCKVILNI